MKKYILTKFKLPRRNRLYRESEPDSRRHQTWKYFSFESWRSPEGICGRFWPTWEIRRNSDFHGARRPKLRF